MALAHDFRGPLVSLEGSKDLNPGDRVHRFTSTERILHWWVVATFSIALLTGVARGGEVESGTPWKHTWVPFC